MRLVVFSHKFCSESTESASGYVTDGGFPFQIRALSQLFDATTLVVPCLPFWKQAGGIPLTGKNLSVAPLTNPIGSRLSRKLHLPLWFLRNGRIILESILRADAVHSPIPGDIGTIGAFLAFLFRKPLFVRYCANWHMPKTSSDLFRKWSINRIAGGRNVVLATGGDDHPPSQRNPNVKWIFSTSLTQGELKEYAKVREIPPQDRVRLIIVGRQEKVKRTDVVIKSLPLLLKEFPGITLDVVGEGSALNEFKSLVSASGLDGNVIFRGRVNHDQVIHLLQRSDVFCFPTTSEGFPKSVLEALACGLAVITTRVSVLPQLINRGCGILIDEATPENMARAVKQTLADPQRYRDMSTKAVETAARYSLEHWRDTIGAMLQEAWGPLKSDA